MTSSDRRRLMTAILLLLVPCVGGVCPGDDTGSDGCRAGVVGPMIGPPSGLPPSDGEPAPLGE